MPPSWYPRITHLNGMSVKPKEGIESAEALFEAINSKIAEQLHGQQEVIYTYSSTKGGLKDVTECILGKARTYTRGRGEAAETQFILMKDALKRQQRVTVSAHSRGTIKTDNAVRAIYDWLYARKLAMLQNAAMKKSAKKKRAQVDTLAEMDAYIQLVYAGNAVARPSSRIKIEAVSTQADRISEFTGTSRNIKSKSGNKQSKLNMYPKKEDKLLGHNFKTEYSEFVGDLIVADLAKEGFVRPDEWDD